VRTGSTHLRTAAGRAALWRIDAMGVKKKKHAEPPEEQLISQAKAAEMCGLTRAAIHELVGNGRLRVSPVEGRDLVFRMEVEELAREGTTDPA
jgi:hypothetical protein